MSNSTITSIYSAALMDHNAHPDYKYELEDATYSHDGINASCGDEMTLYLKVNNDTNVIEEATFTGHGCAISQASADMMIDLIKGKSVKEALRLVNLFLDMIKREVTDDDELEELEDAISLKNISNMPARVKCAVLAWHTLKEALSDDKEASEQ